MIDIVEIRTANVIDQNISGLLERIEIIHPYARVFPLLLRTYGDLHRFALRRFRIGARSNNIGRCARTRDGQYRSRQSSNFKRVRNCLFLLFGSEVLLKGVKEVVQFLDVRRVSGLLAFHRHDDDLVAKSQLFRIEFFIAIIRRKL